MQKFEIIFIKGTRITNGKFISILGIFNRRRADLVFQAILRPVCSGMVWSLTAFVSVAKGNQRFEGVHQDHEEREEVPPSGRKDHNQEEQEEQHHQAETPYATLLIHH